ncbi:MULTISPECIES: DUF6386 family protein [unclassified Pseudomonas]|uniref:DUF6386 family protein n=1 Tax=unclassified Pseudomonas TaxID=196821 RepID=UPI0009DF5E45|nr:MULTISPECIES: DUF6386 family protein [unclassified Pseudomonas]
MSEPYTFTRFSTDTATIAVFDPSALVYRCEDDADWWSVPDDEVTEINSDNVLFVGLGVDDDYEVDVYRALGGARIDSQYISAKLKILSGCLCIGAGEQVPVGDLGPETTYGGVLVYAARGSIEVRIYWLSSNKLVVEYDSTTGEAKKEFASSPAL